MTPAQKSAITLRLPSLRPEAVKQARHERFKAKQERRKIAPIDSSWPTAMALVDAWNAPHSPRYLRFARHALERAARHGLEVLG